MGTDTGGSIRGPSTSNGIVGLKPTHGLLSRSGIIPLALTFDTGGPMARSVYDVAAALGVMTGVDPADTATRKSEGKFSTDYTKELRADALKGARIGIPRKSFYDRLTPEHATVMAEAPLAALDLPLKLLAIISGITSHQPESARGTIGISNANPIVKIASPSRMANAR